MFYKLENELPVRCATAQEWADWYEGAARAGTTVVARDELNGALISTMFTGVDPNMIETGLPLLFETVFFIEGRPTGVVIRSRTWEQAEQEHRRIVAKAQMEADAEDDPSN